MGAKKSTTPAIVLGSIVAGILVFDVFRYLGKRDKNKKSKEWLNWEIQFKDSASDEEKAKIINEIEKKIIDHLYRETTQFLIVKSLRIVYLPNRGNDQMHISISSRFGIASTQGIKTPPPPPPPLKEFFDLLPLIFNIRNLGVNLELSVGNF